MLHRDRAHTITEVESIESLAEIITRHVWTVTTGFAFGDVRLLNDSTAPDAMPEYAVFLGGRQVESISLPPEVTVEEAVALLRAVFTTRGEPGKAVGSGGVPMPRHESPSRRSSG